MKTIVAVLFALALVCLALPASAGMTDVVTGLFPSDDNPLFKEAAAKEQRNLDNMKDHVLTRLNELVKDGVVKPEKMENLYYSVKLYRDDASKAKAIYGNLIQETLDPKVDQTVAWYYDPLLRNGARHQVEIKKNLAELTGVNVQDIQEDFSFGGLMLFICIILILGAIAIGFGTIEEDLLAVVFGMLCGFTFFILILALFGF